MYNLLSRPAIAALALIAIAMPITVHGAHSSAGSSSATLVGTAFIDVQPDGQYGIIDMPIVGASVLATEMYPDLTPKRRKFTISDDQGNIILRSISYPILISICPPAAYNRACKSWTFTQNPSMIFPFAF